jgi:hypothetical protein
VLVNDQAWWSMMRAPARSRLRPATAVRTARTCVTARHDEGSDRLNDRRDLRIDARAPERASVGLVYRARAPGEEYFHENDASVSHPHGEAPGPGARLAGAECEKHALGGTRSLGTTRFRFRIRFRVVCPEGEFESENESECENVICCRSIDPC